MKFNKNMLGILVLCIGVFVLHGCNSDETAEDNIKVAEGGQKPSTQEVSTPENNRCPDLATVEAKCLAGKLTKAGYFDDVSCIREQNNPICQERGRYNTEIRAYKTCKREAPQVLQNTVNNTDCKN